MTACSSQPTNRTEAIYHWRVIGRRYFRLAGDFTKTNGDSSGRKITKRKESLMQRLDTSGNP